MGRLTRDVGAASNKQVATEKAVVSATAAPLRGKDGSANLWTTGGRLEIPWWIGKLTVQCDGRNMTDASISAGNPSLDLTIQDLNITAPANSPAIRLQGGSLTVKGRCAITGGRPDGGSSILLWD